jgi:hypothetical protein
MPRLAAAAGLIAALWAGAGAAQAVPDAFAFGEFEVSLAVVSFDRADILALEVLEINGQPALAIRLAGHLDAAFAEATRGKTGYETLLRICGRTVMHSRLSAELTVADLLYPGLDAGQLDAALELLRNPPCSEV